MKTIIAHKGFTLLDLMIAMVITCILGAVALSVYTGQIRSSRRTDAINTLYSISLAEERYRVSNTTYGTLAQVWNGVTTSTGGYYTLAISGNTASNYTITATATGDQANDVSGSTACNVLTLTNTAGTIAKTPTVCWPS